jgi:hypothetical protein
MQINSIDLPYSNIKADYSSANSEIRAADFSNIIKNEIAKNSSVNEAKKSLETEHNAQITLSSDFSSNNLISGLNNVIIGENTLEKMKSNKEYCEKIMKIIDDNCSSSAQNELKSLSPPVKSSGVIIYPDGSYLCWVESIDSKRESDKQSSEENNTLHDVISERIIESLKDNGIEQIGNLFAMPDIKSPDKKQSK